DFHFREKLTHFDHEPIPERVVHARGSGAHGYFQAYEPMTEFTSAKFLSDPGTETPVFVRFSQVVGFRGSADTVRDVRGFATKFYTEEGNFDLVGNDIPIFFIQDAIKFPDLVHAIKPEGDSEMPQASAAHDTFWDFISLLPEATHMILWLLSDRGIHRSYRMMEGFGVNTFRFVNAEGKARFIKWHWKPVLGMSAMVFDEAQKIAGKDPDFLRRDLWQAIEKGDFPEYELGVQMIEEEREHDFDFDILDPTKFWPEEEVPVRIIGKMTLNKNPDDFFAETEQVAFCPANVVPGIDFSNDPLLQGRLFSYLDTQISRLGGPNFTEIPINRPLAPVHNYQGQSMHRQTISPGKAQYWPNSFGGPHPTGPGGGGFEHYQERIDAHVIRNRSEKFRDFYNQARLFWNSLTDPEKKHIVEAFHFELGKVMSLEVRQRMVELLEHVDSDLASQVAGGIGVEPGGKVQASTNSKSSPAVSMSLEVNPRYKPNAKGHKVAVLLADGFDGDGVQTLRTSLESAGITMEVIAKYRGELSGTSGTSIPVDKSYVTTASVLYDAVFVPGGRQSVEALLEDGYARHFVNEQFKHHKPIGASGDGVELLMAADLVDIELAEGEREVKDQGVVTTRANLDKGFAESFVETMALGRDWSRMQKVLVPA
ncbi:MAG: catalase HPII, partial [Actinobacteria bacterium HGW-Actinobacteria-10]